MYRTSRSQKLYTSALDRRRITRVRLLLESGAALKFVLGLEYKGGIVIIVGTPSLPYCGTRVSRERLKPC